MGFRRAEFDFRQEYRFSLRKTAEQQSRQTPSLQNSSLTLLTAGAVRFRRYALTRRGRRTRPCAFGGIAVTVVLDN
jgi:hypothetical protein